MVEGADTAATLSEARRILALVVAAALRIVDARAWTRPVSQARLLRVVGASDADRGIYCRAIDLLAKVQIVRVSDDDRRVVTPSKRLRKPDAQRWAAQVLSDAAMDIGARMVENEKTAAALRSS